MVVDEHATTRTRTSQLKGTVPASMQREKPLKGAVRVMAAPKTFNVRETWPLCRYVMHEQT